MKKIVIQQLNKLLNNIFDIKELDNGLLIKISNIDYFIESDINTINNFLGYDISKKARIFSSLIRKNTNLIIHDKNKNNIDIFLNTRLFLDGFVLIDGCHIEADGFGFWLRGVEKWLKNNDFNVKTLYQSSDQWNRKDEPFWSIKVGPPFNEPLPGKWKTLFTCVDETGADGAGKFLGHYDEIWVPMPCQVEKIRQMGYVGSVLVVRPPLKWNIREPENPTNLVWVGSKVERKQRDLQRDWNKKENLDIIEINRWEKMLTPDQYKAQTTNSKGLLVTSRSEGYGMPIREFAYSGLPVYGLALPEYDGLIFEATSAKEVSEKLTQPNKHYELSVQLQNMPRHFGHTKISGWFPAATRCGVQSHHQGICEALGIPVVASADSQDKLFVSFHEFYSDQIFNNIPNNNVVVFDIHSISNKSKQKLIDKFGDSAHYIGHRQNHIDGLPNGTLLPLYTRAKRLNIDKQNIVYHSGLLSHAKNYEIFFDAAIKDRNSGWLWKIDVSVPSFYGQEEQDYFKDHIKQLNTNAIINKANVQVNYNKYISDYDRYKMIEQSKICLVLYQSDIELKDSSAFINDALYLKTACISNSNWISEWDNQTIRWDDNSIESLHKYILEARKISIPSWLINNPDKVISQYMDVIGEFK